MQLTWTSDVSGLMMFPSPEFCRATTLRRPASVAPTANDNALPSLAAGTDVISLSSDTCWNRSAKFEQGTPEKNSYFCCFRRPRSVVVDKVIFRFPPDRRHCSPAPDKARRLLPSLSTAAGSGRTLSDGDLAETELSFSCWRAFAP
jgi:hypothetical protein